jgi:hypothetical protein
MALSFLLLSSTSIQRTPDGQTPQPAAFNLQIRTPATKKTPHEVEINSGGSWGSCPTLPYGELRLWMITNPFGWSVGF